ncbi:MAG TPA: phasin family protein [Candidatus Competibacter sp.]|nr:phasin family protein [Candidatus Competibacter sp.]
MKADLFEKQLADNARDRARQIWLAGLGAFAKTQEEGGKFFETLVQEGRAVDARMKKITGEKAERAKDGIDVVRNKADEIRDKASGAWNKLEEVFQTRVARALCRLGVPTRDDIRQLFEQVDLLGRNVRKLAKATGPETKTKKKRAVKSAEAATVGKIADPIA